MYPGVFIWGNLSSQFNMIIPKLEWKWFQEDSLAGKWIIKRVIISPGFICQVQYLIILGNHQNVNHFSFFKHFARIPAQLLNLQIFEILCELWPPAQQRYIQRLWHSKVLAPYSNWFEHDLSIKNNFQWLSFLNPTPKFHCFSPKPQAYLSLNMLFRLHNGPAVLPVRGETVAWQPA